MEYFHLYPVLVPLFAVGIAEGLKILVSTVRQKHLVLRDFFETGGMPSGHSTLVAATATTIALKEGVSSILFMMACTFALLVCYDAMKLRRNVGYHATAINQLLQEKKYNERMGHTPIEVLAGIGLGVGISILLLI